MNLKQLDYIVKIAEEKNITKASEKLFISQSALNQQLLKLESELGVPLFHRVKNAWSLTYAGEIYVNNAKTILEIKNETYKIIGDIADVKKGRLSLGVTPERGTIMFSNIYPHFYKMYPQITVEPIEARTKKLEKLVTKGILDIGFTSFSSKKKTANPKIPIFTEELILAVPSAHKLAPLATSLTEELTPMDLSVFEKDNFILMSKETTLRDIIDDLFDEVGFNPNILFEVSNTFSIMNMVSNGIGCAIIPTYYAQNNGKTVYFSLHSKPSWELAASYKKDSYLTQAARDFIDLVKQFWSDFY